MAKSFIETLRDLSEKGELSKAADKYLNRYDSFLDNLLNVLTNVVLPTKDAGTNDSEITPKSPAFKFSERDKKSLAEIDKGQREAAAEYYRSKGYDVLPEDLVRHPSGGLSMPDFGKSVKRLKMRQNTVSLPQIAETYKEAR